MSFCSRLVDSISFCAGFTSQSQQGWKWLPGKKSAAGKEGRYCGLNRTMAYERGLFGPVENCYAGEVYVQVISFVCKTLRRTTDRCPKFNGTYSQRFAPNSLRGEQIGALFKSHSLWTVVVDVESLEDPRGMKKGQLCSAIAFGTSLGARQRRIYINLSWFPEEQRVFEETFTDWFCRLVRHVEDSLNRASLLASTILLLIPACKSTGWSPFRLQTLPHQVKWRLCPPRARRRGTSTGLSSNHRRPQSCLIPL